MATTQQPVIPGHRTPLWRRRWFGVAASLLTLLFVVLLSAAEYLIHHAEPILRKRITETLSARFGAPVALDGLSLSLLRGLEVSGNGLRIGYRTGTAPVSAGGPMLSVERFRFRTGLLGLLRERLNHQPTHIHLVQVEGLTLRIPPRDPAEAELQATRRLRSPEDISLVVDQIECRDVRLLIESANPGPGGHPAPKPPPEFDIRALRLRQVGRHQAMLYDAELTNAKPVGALHVAGHFGPWAQDTPAGQPGDTPIDGNYTFDHADLRTFRGIGGTLSSAGHFAGVLDRLTIDGHTDTPDFSLSIANHPLPLHTDFHVIVDGTNGDTYLQPVHAWLAGSAFSASGKVVRVKGRGHDIQLDVEIPHGRIQDFLRLVVKTSPPLMNGTLAMHARLGIPPGNFPVPQRMVLAGNFSISSVQFNNRRWQDRLDGLSARATGHPEQARVVGADHEAEAHSQLAADFTLKGGVLAVSDLHYSLPGVLALMNGVYSADGRLFEFKGHLRTDATASRMVGGWKGLLLSPFDHYLQRNGAGIDLPVEVSGTQGDLHFGLAFAGAEDGPGALLADIRAKAEARQKTTNARGLAAQAAAEDRAAAQAATLEEARRHHDLAVRLRAQAQSQLPPPNR